MATNVITTLCAEEAFRCSLRLSSSHVIETSRRFRLIGYLPVSRVIRRQLSGTPIGNNREKVCQEWVLWYELSSSSYLVGYTLLVLGLINRETCLRLAFRESSLRRALVVNNKKKVRSK